MPSPKYYLKDSVEKVQEGDFIYFEMPPMCSGEYYAIVYKDENGLYINQEDNYFYSSYSYRLNKPYWIDAYGDNLTKQNRLDNE